MDKAVASIAYGSQLDVIVPLHDFFAITSVVYSGRLPTTPTTEVAVSLEYPLPDLLPQL
jgi:hypothetical protein